MGRFHASGQSLAALAAGAPSGLTLNGVFASLHAGAAANYKLRRVSLGVVTATPGVPPPQQVKVELHRATVRGAGTGLTTVTGQGMDELAAASAISGLDVFTATALGTTGITVTATALYVPPPFNSQQGIDLPIDYIEEMFC